MTEVIEIVSNIVEDVLHVEDAEQYKEFTDDIMKDSMGFEPVAEEMLSENKPESVRVIFEIINELLDFIKEKEDNETT